jgi:hypothetical protein
MWARPLAVAMVRTMRERLRTVSRSPLPFGETPTSNAGSSGLLHLSSSFCLWDGYALEAPTEREVKRLISGKLPGSTFYARDRLVLWMLYGGCGIRVGETGQRGCGRFQTRSAAGEARLRRETKIRDPRKAGAGTKNRAPDKGGKQ